MLKKQTDSAFFLKLVLYMIVGSQWLGLQNSSGSMNVEIPIGLLIGLLFAQHEHFKIDRKIEYAVLLIATLVGFWTNTGILLTFS